VPSIKIPVQRDIVGYAIVMDASTRTIRIALLRRYAGLMFYLPEGWRGTKYLFIPAGPPIGVLMGTNKPVYIALQFSRTAVSMPLEIPLILKAYGESVDLSSPQGLQKFLQIVGEKVLDREQSIGELQLFDGVAISIPFDKATEYLSNWISTTSKSMFDGLADFWSEIERAASALRGGGAGEWMRYLVYVAIAIAIMMIVFAIVGQLRATPHFIATAVRWLSWL
jgi:hypothetical protein